MARHNLIDARINWPQKLSGNFDDEVKKKTKLPKWYPVCLYDGSKFVSIKKDEIKRQVRLVGTYEMRIFFWLGNCEN